VSGSTPRRAVRADSMTRLDLALADLHAVVAQFVATMDHVDGEWTMPRAPGKWSHSQLVEHVARIMEESAHVAAGAPSRFPTVPVFLRPIARALVFRRILRRNAFIRMKAAAAFNPSEGPRTTAEGRVRLAGALARFDQACRACEACSGQVASTIFGAVAVADFARFQVLHVRHHLP
jgi:hypothetical protein